MACDGCLGLQFEAIGRDRIHGAQHAVKARQNAKLLLHIAERLFLKDGRRHVLILDALVG